MAQMLVEDAEPDRNLTRAIGFIGEAAASGCALIVLPECLDLGWGSASANRLAEPIVGPRSKALSAAAAAGRIVVAAGLTERLGSEVFNSAVLIDSDGRLLRIHRKVLELPFARDLYSVGTDLAVVPSAIGPIGLAICADLYEPEVGIALARLGASIVVSPAAWAVPADHDQLEHPYGGDWLASYRAIAAAGQVPVIGVSSVGRIPAGPWEGRRVIGNSLAVNNVGELAASGPYGENAEALLIVELEVN